MLPSKTTSWDPRTAIGQFCPILIPRTWDEFKCDLYLNPQLHFHRFPRSGEKKQIFGDEDNIEFRDQQIMSGWA